MTFIWFIPTLARNERFIGLTGSLDKELIGAGRGVENHKALLCQKVSTNAEMHSRG
jgi:hypothetical protein